MSIRCETVVTLQSIDALHLVGSQLKIEDVVVLGNVCGIGGAGNGDGATLQMPSEQDLIGRLVVGLGNTGNRLVLGERLDARAAATEGNHASRIVPILAM